MNNRETFSSRIGFILVSAGCAVGLGNVWKFPYMCGQYGGAVFILIYLLFLAILGFPVLVCEYAVGRGSGKSCAASFHILEKKGTRWHNWGYFAMMGNYLLIMFYTMVTGWMLYYCWMSLTGVFTKEVLTTEQVGNIFGQMTGSASVMSFWMMIAVVIAFGICALGLEKGVEKITTKMMACLIVLIMALAVHSLKLPGASKGVQFYLVPDLEFLSGTPKQVLAQVGKLVYGAMSQAFFTLSIGIGAMAICGSYMKKDRSLTGESVIVVLLDTFVALMSGLIIIPACFSFQISPDSGPSLIFLTLPNIFTQMENGRIWSTLFFLFMSFAALSTLIAVFENIISFAIDLWGWERKKAVKFNMIMIILLSMPCVLGFNLLSGVQPLGDGSTIMDLEDFLVSNNILPLGSIVYVVFCVSRYGWGFDKFCKETDTGKGLHFPKGLKNYMRYILPAIVILIYLKGYYDVFWDKGLTYFIPWMTIGIAFLVYLFWIMFSRKK